MREIRTSGSVGGRRGDSAADPTHSDERNGPVPDERKQALHSAAVRAANGHARDRPAARAANGHARDRPAARAANGHARDRPAARAANGHARDRPAARVRVKA
jgi:hypothetical protein